MFTFGERAEFYTANPSLHKDYGFALNGIYQYIYYLV